MTVPYGFSSGRVESTDLPVLSHLNEVAPVSAVVEDFLIRDGFPQVPELWCRATTLTSVEGVVYESLDSPLEVCENSLVKYVAESGYDPQSGVWRPYRSSLVNEHHLECVNSPLPMINEITFPIGRRMISAPAISLEATTFSPVFDSTIEHPRILLSMAVRVRDTLDISYTGGNTMISSGVLTTIGAGTGQIFMSSTMLMRMMFVIMEFTDTSVTTYAADRPSRISRTSIGTRTRAFTGRFSMAGTADIYAMDIWVGDVTPVEIVGEYTAAYGVNP